MMIAGIETFTAVTAILSFGVRSFSDLRCGALVLRYIGIEVIAATPFTFMLARVRSQSVMKAGGPAGAKCAAPASSMSLTTDGPPNWMYSVPRLQAHLLGLLLDQLLLLHHDQRQEADAAGALGDFHHVDFGVARNASSAARYTGNECEAWHSILPCVAILQAACPVIDTRARRLISRRGVLLRCSLPTFRGRIHAPCAGWAEVVRRAVRGEDRRSGRHAMNKLLPTTLVGSYAQPDWLIDREKLAGRFPPRVRAKELWRVAPDYLEAAQDDATLLAIRAQEQAGLDIITDGEMRRESYSNRFATALEGVDIDNPGTALDRSGHPNPVPRVTGKVRRKHPVEVRDVQFLRRNTDRMIKMTVPGPFTMSQQAQNDFYENEEEMALDYAAAVNAEIKDLFAAGADVVQIDEPYMQARPEKARKYGLKALNAALDGVTGTTAVHICFGYAAIIHVRPEGYSFLPEFAGSPVQQVSIETAQSKLDCSVLEKLPGKTILLGVLDLSDMSIETPEEVAARIRRALPHVPAERIIVAPDCGLKYLPRDVAFGKMQAMVAGAAIVRARSKADGIG